MKLALVNSFVTAAREVLTLELDGEVERGTPQLQRSDATADDVTAMIAITGAVRGMVLYSMSTPTAQALAARMIGEPVELLDALGESAIAELANMITGKAGVLLEQADLTADISPPALLVGAGSRISTVDLLRMVVPLRTPCGAIDIHLALDAAAYGARPC